MSPSPSAIASASHPSPASSGQASQDRPRRNRTSKPKVKTGCANCNHLHRPEAATSSCGRASSPAGTRIPTPIPTVPLPPRRAAKQVARKRMSPSATEIGEPSNANSLTLYRPSVAASLQEQEGLYFQLFRSHTARELSGFFDSVFWTQTVLRESHSAPAIRHAVIALGALYKTLEQSTASPPGCHKAILEAITSVVALSGQGQDAHRILLMATVLLACFDSFIGDHKQAIYQIQNGLQLLDQLRAQHSYSQTAGTEPVEDELVQMFTRLAIQAKSYDMAFHFPQPYVIRLTPQNHDGQRAASPRSDSSTGSHSSLNPQATIPTQFSTLLEARRSWDILCESLLRFTETLFVAHNPSGPMGILPRALKRHGLSFKEKLEAWSDAFQPLLDCRSGPSVSYQEKAGIAVLKMFQTMGQILFLMTFAILNPSQCTHRNLATDFLSGQEYTAYHVKASFSADLGIVPPLYVVATKCRNHSIRWQAIRLLRSSSRREGMWDSLLTAHIGEWVATIEEGGDGSPTVRSHPSRRSSSNDSLPFKDDVALGPGGNARWVPEDKRVMVRSVDFDLKTRFARLTVGTRGLMPGSIDLRARETTVRW
ncbi:unnamed protein product [Parascedosporium putredinis]|uniref:C6 zinc finger domain protein n=1 Tax=Parascedosporium putredinis TaxID=1442378 RepID=A0A9P1GU14_9PEZI|nr:unnamed protein product [Parascedosporium putredinis]CAI7987306.1 unnamed protein product [Parascedosporium putredinis]